jgi:hypothetical protein
LCLVYPMLPVSHSWSPFQFFAFQTKYAKQNVVLKIIDAKRYALIVIIKHEHYNTIYALTFVLRWESQISTERSVYHKLWVPYKQTLTLLILFCYFLFENGILCCDMGLNPAHGKMYSIQLYMIHFFKWIATGRWSSPSTRFLQTIKLTDRI